MDKFEKSKKLLDNEKSRRIINIGTYTVLALVSLVMTIINITTHKELLLTLSTGIFVAFCLINIALSFINETFEKFAKVLFSVEVVFLFTYFLISGEPEGFSAIWICMLPSLGMFYFNRFRGTILCIIMFIIMTVLLWTPIGNSIIYGGYTETFKMRFPILFVAFHLLAFLLETLRANAYSELERLQEHYKILSAHDTLTGLYNRQGMYQELTLREEFSNSSSISVSMFDLDKFKKINDKYGHEMGDIVLKRVSNILSKNFDGIVCRWGGEELVVISSGDNISKDDILNVMEVICEQKFGHNGKEFSITVSVGYYKENTALVKNIDQLINNADIALYQAKNSGRNKLVEYNETFSN